MESQDEGQMHELLGLGVQRTGRVRLLEVFGVALPRVEIASAKIRHRFLPSALDDGGRQARCCNKVATLAVFRTERGPSNLSVT